MTHAAHGQKCDGANPGTLWLPAILSRACCGDRVKRERWLPCLTCRRAAFATRRLGLGSSICRSGRYRLRTETWMLGDQGGYPDHIAEPSWRSFHWTRRELRGELRGGRSRSHVFVRSRQDKPGAPGNLDHLLPLHSSEYGVPGCAHSKHVVRMYVICHGQGCTPLSIPHRPATSPVAGPHAVFDSAAPSTVTGNRRR